MAEIFDDDDRIENIDAHTSSTPYISRDGGTDGGTDGQTKRNIEMRKPHLKRGKIDGTPPYSPNCSANSASCDIFSEFG